MPDSFIAVALPGRQDPASVFRAIAAPSRQCFWLDAGPDAGTGWSWVGIGVVEDRPERIREVELTSTPAQSPWEAGRFRGGWIGWLGYEGAAERAGAPVSIADADVPGERWLRVERFVAFDHEHGRAWAVAPADEVEAFAASVSTGTGALAATRLEAVEATARHEPGEYADLIERCRDAIREGDAYQLCLTTRFSVDGPVDPVAAYARLRTTTPAHHGGFIRSGDVALASASPEQFLEVAGGVVRTRPIKGTRPRGADPESDAALADELRENAKERAENIMIVDLMRNDLSRVCEPGSVGVDGLLEVESYPAVHQLVSTVSGTLTEGVTRGRAAGRDVPGREHDRGPETVGDDDPA